MWLLCSISPHIQDFSSDIAEQSCVSTCGAHVVRSANSPHCSNDGASVCLTHPSHSAYPTHCISHPLHTPPTLYTPPTSYSPPTAYPAHSAYPTHSLFSCTCSYSVIHSETCQQKLEKLLMISHACISLTSCPWVHDSIPRHYCTISIVVVTPFIIHTYGHSRLPAWIANCTLESVTVCDLHWCCGFSHAVCPVSCSSPYPPRYWYRTMQ